MTLAPESVSVVVNGDEDNADMLAALLEQDGHRVAAADGGPRALGLLEGEPPDVVFLDLGPSDMDGLEVAAAMRARFGDAFRIIAVTGYSGTSERGRAERSGIDPFSRRPLQTLRPHASLGVGARAFE